jgi:hypothetical protein
LNPLSSLAGRARAQGRVPPRPHRRSCWPRSAAHGTSTPPERDRRARGDLTVRPCGYRPETSANRVLRCDANPSRNPSCRSLAYRIRLNPVYAPQTPPTPGDRVRGPRRRESNPELAHRILLSRRGRTARPTHYDPGRGSRRHRGVRPLRGMRAAVRRSGADEVRRAMRSILLSAPLTTRQREHTFQLRPLKEALPCRRSTTSSAAPTRTR